MIFGTSRCGIYIEEFSNITMWNIHRGIFEHHDVEYTSRNFRTSRLVTSFTWINTRIDEHPIIFL